MNVSNVVMNVIHEVFLSDADDKEDSISLKKLKNRRHNGTCKIRCWDFNFMASKIQSGW